MDYKKAYEEMVQRARELHKGGNALTKKQMEIVCPELAESEDKRVNEEIRNFLIDMECKREWISYLEKQQEQKPAEWSESEKSHQWKPSEEQMGALNEAINTLAASKHPHENDYLFNVLNGLRENLKKL